MIFYTSIQDYFGYKWVYKSIYPKFNFCNVNAWHSLYYSTEYDSDYEDKNDFNELAETMQNDRAEFYSSYNDLCRFNGLFDKFYTN